MEIRLALLVAVTLLVVLGVAGVRRWTNRSVVRLASGSGAPLWSALGMAPDGRPTIVAFSSPSCAACHHAQAPALDSLRRGLGDERLRVVGVDIASRPEVAHTFGVLTVPSTAVLAEDGRLRTINHGFTPAHRLLQQLTA
jgi:thioredoxin-like negative regulator of GroEL